MRRANLHRVQRHPITVEEARERGISLRGRDWKRLGHKVYARRDVADDPFVRLKAATRRLPDTAVFSGRTAAFLHGLDSRLHAIEATLSPPTRTAHLVGMTIRRATLGPDDVVLRYGLRVTSLLRTAIDIARREGLVEAVVALDAAMHHGVPRQGFLRWADAHRGYRGVRDLRDAIALAEPLTESPMETRLRMALVLAGLPNRTSRFPSPMPSPEPTSTTPTPAWSSSTTAPPIATASPPTTAARTASSTPAIASSASPRPI